VEKFLAELTSLVPDEPITAASFIADPGKSVAVIEVLCNLKDQMQEKEIENQNLNDHLNELYKRLQKTSFIDSLKALESLIDEVSNLRRVLADLDAKQKRQTKVIRQLKSNSAKFDERKEIIQKDYQQAVASLESDKSQLRASLDEAQKQLKDLKSEVSSARTACDDKIAAINDSHRQEIHSLESRLDRLQKEAEASLQQKDQDARRLSEQIAEQDRESAQSKQCIESLTAILSEKDHQLQLLRVDNEQQLKESRARTEKETTAIRAQHQAALDETRARNRELQEVVSKYANALDESQSRNQALTVSNTELQARNGELASKVNSYRDGRSRDQKLVQARLRAMELAANTQRQIDMDKLKAQYEEERRRLVAFAANSLAQFVDLRKELTTEAFQELITRTANELKKHEEQEAAIRKLMRLSSLESCEEAVAELVHSTSAIS
jgi:hypothetical protein